MNAQKQQGDVLFLRINSIPDGAIRISPKNNMYVLVEGEMTGHAHRIEADTVELYERDDVLYMKVSEPSTVVHEEHGNIVVEPGVWEIGQVVEVDPFEREIRSVAD